MVIQSWAEDRERRSAETDGSAVFMRGLSMNRTQVEREGTPQPGPLPSDGRGRIVGSLSAAEALRNGSWARCMRESETRLCKNRKRRSKNQDPRSRETSRSKNQGVPLWCLMFLWSLELGFWSLRS